MITSITPTEATKPCPECQVCGEETGSKETTIATTPCPECQVCDETPSQETENTGECLTGDYVFYQTNLHFKYMFVQHEWVLYDIAWGVVNCPAR